MRRILLLVTAVITVLALSGIKAEAKSEKASVMSFNIRIQFPADTGKYNWESRKAGCVKAIRKYLPDIIGLQEAAPGQKSLLDERVEEVHYDRRQRKTRNRQSGFRVRLQPDLLSCRQVRAAGLRHILAQRGPNSRKKKVGTLNM